MVKYVTLLLLSNILLEFNSRNWNYKGRNQCQNINPIESGCAVMRYYYYILGICNHHMCRKPLNLHPIYIFDLHEPDRQSFQATRSPHHPRCESRPHIRGGNFFEFPITHSTHIISPFGVTLQVVVRRRWSASANNKVKLRLFQWYGLR